MTTFCYGLAVVLSEKISVGGGFGWDGGSYGLWARTFPAPLLERSLNRYLIQRIAPSAFVHWTLCLLRIEATPAHVIHSFEGWAIGLVCAGAWIWIVIARRLRLTVPARWFGAVALFGSYASLKWTAYYPVLTDLWSVVLALLQLLLFLDRRRALLAVVTFVGAFTWPTSAGVGAILIVFLPLPTAPSVPVPLPGRLRFVLAGIAAVSWALLCKSVLDSGYEISSTAPLCHPLVRLSLAASVGFVFCAISVLIDDRALFSPRPLLRYVLRPNLLVAAVVILAAGALQAWLAPPPSPYPVSDVLRMTAYTSLQKPAVFLVAHVMFLGPALLLLVLRWRAVLDLARRSGPGLVAVAGLGTILFLNSESRHVWNIAAMFIPFAVKRLDDLEWTPRRFLALAALTLVSSNVWLTYEDIWPDPLQFPAQLFFMTDGPWMSIPTYVAQLAIVVAYGAWVGRQLGAAERATATSPTSASRDRDTPMPVISLRRG